MTERATGEVEAITQLGRIVEHLRSTPVADPVQSADATSAAQFPADLHGLVDRVRVDVAARRSGFVEQDASIRLRGLPAHDAAFPRAQRAHVVGFRGEYVLGELLHHDEAEFVRNAYRALLHRDPDHPGFVHFLHMINGGVSKLDILRAIAQSPEGRTVGTRIHGLDRALFMQRVRATPIVGPIFAMLQYALSLPWILRRLERQERELARTERELREAIDALAAAAERFANEVSGGTRAAIESMEASLDRLDREKASRGLGMALTGRVAVLSNEIARESNRRATREEVLRLASSTLNASKAIAAKLGDCVASTIETAARVDDWSIATKETAARLGEVLVSSQHTAARLGEVVVSSQHTAARLDEVIVSSQKSAVRLDEVIVSSQKTAARLDASLTRDGIERVLAQNDPALDDFYVDFEATFRGSRDAIRERMAVYLPIVKAAKAGSARTPILDLGCGRGEWLQLLKESGMTARGIDINGDMVEHCRALGLDVRREDLMDYLQTLADDSLGALTGMHIIEHLPFRRFIALLDESLRVLQPGGVAIFETPNPENVIVGSCNFWYDPTHERPLPPPSTQRALELRGFADVAIVPLHPFPAEAHFPADDPGSRDRLNHLFYGPQDYAVVAHKPAAEKRV